MLDNYETHSLCLVKAVKYVKDPCFKGLMAVQCKYVILAAQLLH